MKRIASLCLLLVVTFFSSRPALAQAPVFGVSRLSTLTDGVRLILRPEADTDIVAITVFVRLPPPTTSSGAALREMTARALLFSSLNLSFEGVASSVALVGGNLETLVTPDYAAYTCLTVSAQIREALFMLSEALTNADFAPEALLRARRLIQEAQHPLHRSAAALAAAAVAARLDAPAEPEESDLARVTTAQAAAYFRLHYTPANTVVSIAGGFDAKRTEKSCDDFFFAYERATPRARPTLPDVPSDADNPPPLTLPTPGGSAYALVAASAPSVSSPDYPAFLVLQTLLGDGHASRLFRRLRDSLGLGYNVGATFNADRGEPLIASLQWTPATTSPVPADALKLLQSQMNGLLSDPPTDAELTRARNLAIGRDALRHERARERAFLPGWYEVMGAGYALDAELPHRLEAVSRADLLRVARTYLARRASLLALPKDH